MRLGYNARLGLGLSLVAILTIIFCWQTSVYIEKTAGNLTVYVSEARNAAQSGNWPAVADNLRQGMNDWQKARPFWLGLLNHQDVSNIDLAFHSLQAFQQQQRTDEVLNHLSLLDYYLNLAVESDRVNLSNLF